MHPHENIVWQALTTRQRAFAESRGDARRFLPEVSPLAGFPEPIDKAFESLANLLGPKGTAIIFQDSAFQSRPGWNVIGGGTLYQMVYRGKGSDLGSAESSLTMVPLGGADSAEMVALARLTKPGPFGPRTHELGSYVGVRREGKLVAMAGERMKIPGYTEVSAVCTHPEHTGHGYGAALIKRVMCGICDRGDVPILHVREDNARAIALYHRLGFQETWLGHFVVLRGDSNV